jgi:hypothetical protein
VPGTDTGRVLLHAAKLVAGRPEPMYDLEFSYSSTAAAWDGDFANARVSIRWSHWIRRDTLRATVVLLPTRRVGRHVVAWREAGGNPPR